MLFNSLKAIESKISFVSLTRTHIDDDAMDALGEYIESNPSIQNIWLSRCLITDKGIECLSDYLYGNSNLKSLNIEENKGITDKSTPYLVNIIRRSVITKLFFYGTLITDLNRVEINMHVKMPVEEREISIKSNSKSAAKSSFT